MNAPPDAPPATDAKVTASDERLRRNEPARDRPRRAFNALASASGDPPPGPAEPMTADAIIANAVDAAYRVAEENMREGQHAAERLRAGVMAAATPPESAREIATRLMHMAKELGLTWVDLVMTVLRDPEMRGLFDRLGVPERAVAEPATPPRALSITQRINSRQPVEVTLSPLAAVKPDQAPMIAGLHGMDPLAPAIRQVMFAVRADGGLEMHIAVSDDHPPGLYTGVIVDRASQQAIGTLSLRVLE